MYKPKTKLFRENGNHNMFFLSYDVRGSLLLLPVVLIINLFKNTFNEDSIRY